jgi:hypothetical protein
MGEMPQEGICVEGQCGFPKGTRSGLARGRASPRARAFADGTMMSANIALPVAASGAQRECTFAGTSTAE